MYTTLQPYTVTYALLIYICFAGLLVPLLKPLTPASAACHRLSAALPNTSCSSSGRSAAIEHHTWAGEDAERAWPCYKRSSCAMQTLHLEILWMQGACILAIGISLISKMSPLTTQVIKNPEIQDHQACWLQPVLKEVTTNGNSVYLCELLFLFPFKNLGNNLALLFSMCLCPENSHTQKSVADTWLQNGVNHLIHMVISH